VATAFSAVLGHRPQHQEGGANARHVSATRSRSSAARTCHLASRTVHSACVGRLGAPKLRRAGVCSTPAQHCHTNPAARSDKWDVVDMPHRTTPANSIKSWNRPLTWVRTAIGILTQLLFASSDASAQRYGWQVTSTRLGLGRQYRDPRFDLLRSCPGCRGRSVLPGGIKCPTCRGSGRITIKPAGRPSSGLPPRGLT
jgi:hypothetical protein